MTPLRKATSAGAVPIRYGDQSLTVRFPEGCAVDVASRSAADKTGEIEILTEALQRPLNAPPLGEFMGRAQTPLIVVNDATRSTPTAKILRAILPEIRKSKNWHVIIATGLHRAPTDSELARLFGDAFPDVKPRLLIHDGYNEKMLARWDGGEGPILVHRALSEAERLILISSVEPHFFAGFTGGRKSIVPGLAGRETVERSHAGAVHQTAAPMRIVGNPVREFIHKNTMFLQRAQTWSIQVVLDRDDRIAAAFAGDIDKTFIDACAAAQKYYAVALTEPYDIVLAAVYPPLDVNLYQAQKGWELSLNAVRDNGVMIVTSACPDGIGSPFYAQLSETFPNKDQWVALADQPYTVGLHKLVRTGRARAKMRLMAVTNMPAETVTPFGYEAHTAIDSAVAAAVAHTGTPARALVVQDAGLTTMTVKQEL
jgi:nickel-dependent lactate racemase